MDSLKRNNFFKIEYPFAFKTKLKPPKGSNIIALDTETQDGLCKLICDSDGRSCFTESSNDCFEFLTNKSLNGTTNIFWNIDYDFRAIIKYLPREFLETIYYLGKCQIGEYTLSYIPSKWFGIRQGKKRYDFFDMLQFYSSSLNKASKHYLGKEKIDYPIKQLMLDKTWNDFIEKERIKQYCLMDCKLTYELGQKLANKFTDIGLSFKKPYSIANLSAQWVQRNCIVKDSKPTKEHYYAFQSYHGGRFEILKRGLFEDVYEIDISSAYPKQIIELLDITNGEWIESETVLEDADIGFIKCNITLHDRMVSPICLETKSQLIFPNVNNQSVFLSLKEYQFIRDNFDCSIAVENGQYFFARNKVYPFAKMKEIYDLKDSIKGKDEMLYNIYKIILNSFYGKTIEIKYKWEKIPQDRSSKDCIMIETPTEAGLYQKVMECGRYFNPVYASIITSGTRLQLMEILLKNRDSSIACFTDSIFTTSKPSCLSEGLGGWALKGKGSLLMVQCGVYTFKSENEVKTRLRGFHTTDKVDLIDWFEKNPHKTGMERLIEKPQLLGETLFHESSCTLENFNSFVPIKKTMNINADNKRKWERKAYNCYDLLHNQISSIPLEV